MSQKNVPAERLMPFLTALETYHTTLQESSQANQRVSNLQRQLEEALQAEALIEQQLATATLILHQNAEELNQWATTTGLEVEVTLKNAGEYFVSGNEASLLISEIHFVSATVLKGLLPVLRGLETSEHAERVYRAGIASFRDNRTGPASRPELYRAAGYQKKDLYSYVSKFVPPPSLQKAKPTTRRLVNDIVPSETASWSKVDLRRTLEILQKVHAGELTPDQVPLFDRLQLHEPSNWQALLKMAMWLGIMASE